jgi:hypothetical protein
VASSSRESGATSVGTGEVGSSTGSRRRCRSCPVSTRSTRRSRGGASVGTSPRALARSRCGRTCSSRSWCYRAGAHDGAVARAGAATIANYAVHRAGGSFSVDAARDDACRTSVAHARFVSPCLLGRAAARDGHHRALPRGDERVAPRFGDPPRRVVRRREPRRGRPPRSPDRRRPHVAPVLLRLAGERGDRPAPETIHERPSGPTRRRTAVEPAIGRISNVARFGRDFGVNYGMRDSLRAGHHVGASDGRPVREGRRRR